MTEALNTMLDELGGFALPEPAPSSHYSPGITSSIEERAMHLLGLGIPAEQTAAALGVTASRISQLLAEKTFADRVSALRYENLQKHNKRDAAYDTLEDKLTAKLEKSLPLLVRPDQILAAIKVVNGAKRRGTTSTVTNTTNNTVVNLVMPVKVAQQFVKNVNNQVIKAGEQVLQTMQSSDLLRTVEIAAEKVKRIENGNNSSGASGENEGS